MTREPMFTYAHLKAQDAYIAGYKTGEDSPDLDAAELNRRADAHGVFAGQWWGGFDTARWWINSTTRSPLI